MRCFIGIDLGSTTTKAVVIDENQNVLGRGITNSRSNYDTAAAIAKQEALVNGRFYLFRQALGSTGALNGDLDTFLGQLERDFRSEQYLEQLGDLEATCQRNVATAKFGDSTRAVGDALTEVFRRLAAEAHTLFAPGARRKSDFFRDIAGAQYLATGEAVAKESGIRYDFILNVFDRSIIEVENRVYGDSIRRHLLAALERTFVALPGTAGRRAEVEAPIKGILDMEMEETYVVGTGYGRARLPFSKEHIRSEILCHGLGAHMMHPGTATVLDIGGQDTKAIQVDPNGIVESFQMNDRCAAGCGRYLGYIADEMNMGLHELGPDGDEVDQDDPHQLDVHGVRRRRAARPPVARRQARGHHGGAASRDHPARDVDPRALGRHPQRVHVHRRRREERGGGEGAEAAGGGELRRADAQHQPGLDLHGRPGRRHVRVARGGRGGQGRRGAGGVSSCWREHPSPQPSPRCAGRGSPPRMLPQIPPSPRVRGEGRGEGNEVSTRNNT